MGTSVVDAVLLRPLAYHEPEQQVALRGAGRVRNWNEVLSSAAEHQDFRRDVPALRATHNHPVEALRSE